MNKNNKKVAILTQAPIGTNYGNTVQAFALQEFLKSEGYNPIVLDRVKSEIYNITHWSISNVKNEILNFFDKKNRLTPRVFNSIFKDHFQFVKENINISERIHNDNELNSHFQRYDYYGIIVGSDQTWRPKYSPNIYNYFLDFLTDNNQIRKVAYASSFGTDQWEFSEEEMKKCKDLVQLFDAVSVREESGVYLCEKYLDVKATWVLDPTLLLKKSDYVNLVNKKPTKIRKGIFSYVLDENDYVERLIKEAKEILQIDDFTNQPKWRKSDKSGQLLENLKYPSVESWLQAFYDADFIVTDSFHGTVFSIIFNKPFVTIINKERGASRFYSLLEKFDLTDRIINEETQDLKSIIFKPIDYDGVNEKINLLRKESANFLLTSLLK